MESTAVYWKPIYNILAAAGFEVLLVNAKHIKNVPGRKTDVQDCQWIGQLQGSFIPPEPIRELRDLTRQRKQLVRQRASCIQRIQKVLEDTNIKLSSVATDVVGKSGWDMLKHIVAGESDSEKMADLARGRLKSKREDLVLALEGRVIEHHRFMLRQHMHHIEFLDTAIGEYDQRIEEQTRPFDESLPLLDTIPGINHTAACALIAEFGANMDQFPDEHHLSSWGGVYARETTRARASIAAGKHDTGANGCGHCWLK